MELIATARFKKAMDRATAATAYTQRITQVVKDLAAAGLKVTHPLLEPRDATGRSVLLVLTANRGLCGGYNGSILRIAVPRINELKAGYENFDLEVSGKRGISALRFRGFAIDQTYTKFEDQPAYSEVQTIADRFLDEYTLGKIDRLDVAYTRFISSSRQEAVVETLLPLGSIGGEAEEKKDEPSRGESMYEFLPSAESILEEVVPASFRVKLFKCFLDAAVSEQIARMVAMKAATENAQELIKNLSRTYNRARQSQITGEIMEIIGGVEALNK